MVDSRQAVERARKLLDPFSGSRNPQVLGMAGDVLALAAALADAEERAEQEADNAVNFHRDCVAAGIRAKVAEAALADTERRSAEDARKIEAYDAARATVKMEGNTRAYYVLRAEAAEARVAELEDALKLARAGVADVATNGWDSHSLRPT